MTRNLTSSIRSTSKKLDRAVTIGDRSAAVILSYKYEKLMEILRNNLKVKK
jgi:hypothetical protein